MAPPKRGRCVYTGVEGSPRPSGDQSAAGQLETANDKDRTAAGLKYLLDACCNPDTRDSTVARSAAGELRAWTGRHPDRAVALLNERRLAVRILFATFFAEKFGAAFQFDPWDAAPVREAALARITGQVGATENRR